MSARPFQHLRTLIAPVLLVGFALAVLAGGDMPRGERRQGKRVEEEDDRRPIRREVLRLDEDEPKQKTPAVPARDRDLAEAAREARHEKVRTLFRDLAVPADEVVFRPFSGVKIDGARVSDKPLRVAPLAAYIADPSAWQERLRLTPLEPRTKGEPGEEVNPRLVQSLRYYEQLAGEKVQAFLDERLDRLEAADARHLPRADQLAAAEQALAAVLRFHLSARERGVRQGDGWDRVEAALRGQLLGVGLLQLERLTEGKEWDGAFALMRRLAGDFQQKAEAERLVAPFSRLLRQAHRDETFRPDGFEEARARLRMLEDQFPGSPLLQPIRDTLRERAQMLLDRARKLVEQDKKAEALELLKQAENVWPELPGLHTYRLGTDQSHRILRVAVRDLPRYLSPALATSDSELRAVELLFEGLVTLVPDEGEVLSYRPTLAEGRPRIIPLGREFQLPRQAVWSDGKPLTVGDLRYSVQQMQEGKATGWSAAWGELLDRVQVEADPFRVKLRLRQGFLDPLAPLSFKVVPARSRPNPSEREFALRPVSSGPFLAPAEGPQPDPSQKWPSLAFRANPAYAARGGRAGLPRIREVRLCLPPNPVAALQARQIDLATDLTAAQAAELSKAGFEVTWPSAKVPNRRITFLAVNHRKGPLANADLRVALARAIAREALLDAHFRGDAGRKVHRALNGPYPAGSWACDPALVSRADSSSLDPHDPDLARTKWKQALAKLATSRVSLTLKYPSGDAQLAAALSALCQEVGKVLPGLELTPQERTPHELREEVEATHSYDLAYYHHDFADGSYWLYPLLGPTGRNGAENYLGYTGGLVSRVQAATTLRHFSQVREYARAIHRQLLESEMPLIPLWQLDPLHAYRRGDLEIPPVDPQMLFTRVEEWRVLRR